MKIKITNSDNSIWCQENLGKEFEVIKEETFTYLIKVPSMNCIIHKKYCEVVQENSLEIPMDKQEILERLVDLYDYVQTTRNSLAHIDEAIAQLSIDIKKDWKNEKKEEEKIISCKYYVPGSKICPPGFGLVCWDRSCLLTAKY